MVRTCTNLQSCPENPRIFRGPDKRNLSKTFKKKAEDRAESLRVRISPLPTLAQGSGEIFEKQSSFGKGNVWLWIIT